VRLSGQAARDIALTLFSADRGRAPMRSHRLVHGVARDPRTGALLDDCLLCYMEGPHSYTGEDVVEFQCHGSPVILQQIVRSCLESGAVLAKRGEFTLRAFLNGRLDLAQAESVVDLVRARTPTAAQVAAQGVNGALSRRIEPIARAVTGALAYLEATIDFVEEGLPEKQTAEQIEALEAARAGISELLSRASHGALLRDGVRVVLAGKPNVGKSSLLNALLRRDRAIVTPIAGTTRDTLEEAADILGVPMYLVDTAGLTKTEDAVEKIGVERGRAAIASAGIVVLTIDAAGPLEQADRDAASVIRETAPAAPLVIAVNKCDLPSRAARSEIDNTGRAVGAWHPFDTVRCSAVTGDGLATLEDALARAALGGAALHAEDTLVENARQAQALREALDSLDRTLQGLACNRPVELVCIDLREALDALSGITGVNVTEAVLDRIFADFCIGK
jgi:tRNA modification GTPase